MADRRMRIEVGYRLEGSITDLQAKRMIDEILVPNFKNKNYAAGLESVLEACNDLVLHGESIQLKSKRAAAPSTVGLWELLLIWVFLTVIVPVFARLILVRRARSFPSELRPTMAEASLLRTLFVSTAAVSSTVLILVSLGIVFIVTAQIQSGIAFIVLLFAYAILWPVNKGYFALRNPKSRRNFLAEHPGNSGGELPWQAFDAGSAANSGSSGDSSSSEGGSSGGGGASGSW